MEKLILTIACFVTTMLLFSSCNPQNESINKLVSNNPTAPIQNEEKTKNSNSINGSTENKIFEKDKVKEDWKETVVINDCSVKDGPGKGYASIGNLKYGDTILLEGSYNGWFLARSNNTAEFWIDGKNVADYDYNYDKKIFGVVTAEKAIMGQVNLYKGNLVWILKKDAERAYVRPVAIDINAGYSGWINNSDFTMDKQNVYFNQAFLKKDAKVYRDNNEKLELYSDFNKLSGGYIFIGKVQNDGWLYISALGGISGWVKNTDIYLP